jgi:hypothetical protein
MSFFEDTIDFSTIDPYITYLINTLPYEWGLPHHTKKWLTG